MARPTKTGLSYFPVDVDIFEDEKLQFISAKFGLKGEAIVFRLLSKIYRNGYYIVFDEDVQLLFSKAIGLERNDNATRNVVSELLKRDFFDKTMFEQFQVLTSKGIQKRYLRICHDSKRVACNLLPKYDLTQEKQEFPQEETRVSTGGNCTKKSKEKESKENKNILLEAEIFEKDEVPVFVQQNRENVAPTRGGRASDLTKEFLREDFLNNERLKTLYEQNKISDSYETVVQYFIDENFGLGRNENWRNIQDARFHLKNSFKFYQNANERNNKRVYPSKTDKQDLLRRRIADNPIVASDGVIQRFSKSGATTFAG